ncbi:hypothetical protein LGK95_16805 [Clostridium algoriphilum]|uniref:hypothetical protein n=1 Tax=Clostridium algoriphilum TaxID=198347 RepID=UPI001CF42E6A|nr:hypothetical protein [Clostridium algoriphilum]MCB2295146.1 hypothetical protein [Clostridium algoriphilum]
MATEKKRSGYSFSIKKTDNPIIKEFITAQDNFSESIRYLIIKYCMENGVEDVSSKLNELIYSLAYSNTNTSNSNEMKQSSTEEKIVEKAKAEKAVDEISIDLEKADIPKCYQ